MEEHYQDIGRGKEQELGQGQELGQEQELGQGQEDSNITGVQGHAAAREEEERAENWDLQD